MYVKHFKKITPALIITLSLSGCTSDSGPAQIENKQNIVFTRHGAMEMIRIYPHDTIESISHERGIPVEIIAATNNLSYPYHLYNIRTLMIPQGQYHIVNTDKETLQSIANQYHVDLMQLIDINNMMNTKPNQKLRPGTTIIIPTYNNITQHIDDKKLTPVYIPTKEYDVMALDEIHNDQQNELDSNDNEFLYNQSSDTDLDKDLESTLGKNNQDEPLLTTDISGFRSTTPLNSELFIWPLNGTISRNNKDGITIAAPLNTPVRAAGSGKVIFAENDNGEYGNLVIIKHQDQYLSAYAHNNQILVKKGEEVNKGQIISKVGKSGKVSKTQLFFSMRKGKDIINPEKDIQ